MEIIRPVDFRGIKESFRQEVDVMKIKVQQL